MTTFLTFVHALLACNLHFCLYAAFGLYFLHRAQLCAVSGRREEMRELAMHGIVYVLLGTL